MNSRNAILTTLLLFFITVGALISLDCITNYKAKNLQRTAFYNSLLELEKQIGYVGLIHNFKNYILRPTEIAYRDKALDNYQNAQIQVNKIEALGTNILGKLEMRHTRDMLTAYKERLALLPEFFGQNLTVREIDSYARYDDLPSFLEIESTAANIISALNSQISDILYRSLKLTLIILIAFILTLTSIIRFFFKEQQQALQLSHNLNIEMEKHKNVMNRSQNLLLSVMEDVQKEKGQTATLNKQLLSKNKEMEQFIYTVSHDLKSPLVTINAFTQKLLTELSESLSQKQAYRFSRILENVNNMEALLTDLLDLSKVVQQAITFSTLDVKALVEKQCKSLENTINETHTSIRLADNLHNINANSRLFSEAILNLLSNAIRYRSPSRQLVIDISTTQSRASTCIHIKDNGMGIDPKYHQLIFDIFERLSTGEGTGVGLTIVKTIMEKHHGLVTLASAPDNGCCFSLSFPNRKMT